MIKFLKMCLEFLKCYMVGLITLPVFLVVAFFIMLFKPYVVGKEYLYGERRKKSERERAQISKLRASLDRASNN